MLKYYLSDKNIHIIDSHTIETENDMKNVLNNIKYVDNDYTKYSVCKRTISNMINEWRAHNLLYKFNLLKRYTRDVDLEYPQNYFYKFYYWLLSKLYNLQH